MTARSAAPPLILVALATAFGVAVYTFLFGGGLPETPVPDVPQRSASPAPSRTAAPTPPQVTIAQQGPCCTQTARFLRASWTATERVLEATIRVEPDPGFACEATIDGSAVKGAFGCVGLLRGATDHVATLSLRTAAGTFPFTHRFRTMGDRLTDVKWFTEFEDPKGDPLACAAASIRIVHNYTTGRDAATAEQILAQGRTMNRSRDPGLDPVGIASVQRALDARNTYHYYRFDSKEQATAAAVYWLLRSGKPVHAITLAGQHDPLVIGFTGTYGTFAGDQANRITAVVVEDPQRGDMRPETANRRPDKYRTPEFQTGRALGLDEWYRDEWWFGFAYTGVLDGVNIDRSDGFYALPHWAGKFVLLVDDGDADWPSDREGRVRW